MTNMKALSVSTIETVIVFRSCTPIAVSFVEYYFMNRELPNWRSAISLFGVAFGELFYIIIHNTYIFIHTYILPSIGKSYKVAI
jgi:hypothetical protein